MLTLGNKRTVVVAIVALSCISVTSVAVACHSNYFNRMFVTLKDMRDSKELTTHQVTAMWEHVEEFNTDWKKTASQGKPNSALDPYVERFVAAAAGVLNNNQFTKMTGKKKTEVQELRYEVNELRRELKELREMIRSLKKAHK